MERPPSTDQPHPAFTRRPRTERPLPSAHPAAAAAKRGRLLATALAALACLSVQAIPAVAAGTDGVVSRGVSIPAFYTPPASLPAADGALIRTEPLPLALSLPGLDGPLPGTATRLMYKSTDSNGRPVAVTGAYIEPSAAWKGGGPRPLVAVAPGTMGQGDQCAASMGLEHPLSLNGDTVSVGYEDLAIYRPWPPARRWSSPTTSGWARPTGSTPT